MAITRTFVFDKKQLPSRAPHWQDLVDDYFKCKPDPRSSRKKHAHGIWIISSNTRSLLSLSGLSIALFPYRSSSESSIWRCLHRLWSLQAFPRMSLS